MAAILKLAFGVWLLAAGALQAGEGPVAPMNTVDSGRGWEAVGRLHIGQGSFCTASLISPTLVLTAAHCLFDEKTGARIPDVELEFRAAYRGGRAEAYRGARRSIVHPDYAGAAPESPARVAADLALIELDQPIQKSGIAPFALGRKPGEGDSVQVVSYAVNRAEAPSLQNLCHVLGAFEAAQVLSCQIDFGSSGAPIFVVRDGVARIVSVVSSKARMDGQRVALVAPVEDAVQMLAAQLAAQEPVFRSSREPERIARGVGLDASGAKFLRP